MRLRIMVAMVMGMGMVVKMGGGWMANRIYIVGISRVYIRVVVEGDLGFTGIHGLIVLGVGISGSRVFRDLPHWTVGI